jgi:hypothetical protein
MSDITKIPEAELKQDLKDSYADILTCEIALRIGDYTYSGGSIQERLDANKHFVKVITAELKRREQNVAN